MTSYETILLSRWQFTITAMYHFLFVPLALVLSALLGESWKPSTS